MRPPMLALLTGAELSAAEVARELGTTQANAGYHLSFQLGAGLLVIRGRRPRRLTATGTPTCERSPT